MRFLVAVAVLLIAGCSVGPVWTQRVDGRVLDGLTGKGVPGATVSAYHNVPVLFAHGSHAQVAKRSTRTGADGFFVLEGRFAFGLQIDPTPYFPELVVEHPEYDVGSWDTASGGRHEIEVPMRRQGYSTEGPFAWDRRCYPADAEPCFWACYGEPSCLERRLIRPR